MELYSLHPFPEDAPGAFLRRISEDSAPSHGNTEAGLASQFWFRRITRQSHPRPDDVSFGFAAWLARAQPVFAQRGVSLSAWEARIDRGTGMLLRPPSRLFGEAGLDTEIARAMPIRIQPGDGMMGGAFVPARLMHQYLDRLDVTFERSVRRAIEAELDAVAVLGTMYEAARYAAQHGMGLFEAVDLLDATEPASWPPGARVITRSTDTALIERIRLASVPLKEPGLIARLFGRRG